MALIHELKEIIPYYDIWLAKCDIIDNITTQRYYYEWQFHEQVTSESQILIDQIDIAKVNIQTEILYQQNDMNLPQDEEKALEYLRSIKLKIIEEIRENPNVTLTQAQTWVNNNYPNSIINFNKLYGWYLGFLKLSTWNEFKEFVINHKFQGVN